MKTLFLGYVLGLSAIWLTYFTAVWLFKNDPKRGRRFQTFSHPRIGRKVPRLCTTHFVKGDSRGRPYTLAVMDNKNCELCKKERVK